MSRLSANRLFQVWKDGIIRFPITNTFGFFATLLLILGNEFDWHEISYWGPAVFTVYLGIPLFFALELKKDSQGLSIKQGIYLFFGGLFLCWVFYDLNNGDIQSLRGGIRVAGYALILHLWVSFWPVKNARNDNAFWQFNRVLFIRVFTTGLYTAVLQAGLAGALVAIKTLFDLDFEEKPFMYLFFTMAGVIPTMIFTSGIPKGIESMDEVDEYPKGLRIFAQYILLPIVAIYMLILYMYGMKIVVLWELPKGWVSNLIMAFSVVGILAVLLLHPYGNQSENKILKPITKWFYRLIIPLLILLYIAALYRIGEYGFTVLRYFLLGLAIWLTYIISYMVFFKDHKLRIVPLSLMLVAILSIFTPFVNAWSVSEASQKYRLVSMLKEHKMWDSEKGEIKKSNEALPDSVATEMHNIVMYLFENHETTGLEPKIVLLGKDSLGNEMERYNKRYALEDDLDQFGIRDHYNYAYAVAETEEEPGKLKYPTVSYNAQNHKIENEMISLSGNYKHYVQFLCYDYNENGIYRLEKNHLIIKTLNGNWNINLEPMLLKNCSEWKYPKKSNQTAAYKYTNHFLQQTDSTGTILIENLRMEYNEDLKSYELKFVEGTALLR